MGTAGMNFTGPFRFKGIGGSRLEPDLLDTSREILASASDSGMEILLPHDHVCAEGIDAAAGEVYEEAVPEFP